MENPDATQNICFTLAPHSDGNGIKVTKIQIDSKDAIPIDTAGPLTAESAQIIAKEFTDKQANKGVIVDQPTIEPAENTQLSADDSAKNMTASPDVLPPPPPPLINDIMNAQLTGKYQQYTLGSLLTDLDISKGKRTPGRFKLAEFIRTKIGSNEWANLNGEEITKAIVSEVGTDPAYDIGFHSTNKEKRLHKLVLGGAVKTVKNLHTRRKVKSNTRKGHVYRSNVSRRAAPNHRVTRRR